MVGHTINRKSGLFAIDCKADDRNTETSYESNYLKYGTIFQTGINCS